MARSKTARPGRPWTFIILCGFLTLVFFTGGGSRADIQSLALLRPVAMLVAGFALWGFSKKQFQQFRIVFILLAAAFLMIAAQLVPLPPSVWSHFPGRALIVQVDQIAGLGPVWRPISLVPSGTWNALYSLFVPFAVLALATKVDRERRYQLLGVFIAFGVASGLLGLLQVVNAPGGILYLYEVTNKESAVGFFSNRNHQAIYLACIFPMLAVYASSGIKSVEQYRTRSWIAVVVGAALIPLLLVTGSRAGLVLGLAGLGSVPLLFDRPRPEQPAKRRHANKSMFYFTAGIVVMGLGTLTFLFSRAQAFERIIAPDQTDNIRLSFWGPIAHIGWKYFPIGSGIGSFAEVYQIDEPDKLLNPAYLNHAHNDWLELYMTGGMPAMLLMLSAIVVWAIATNNAWRSKDFHRRDILYARMGSIIAAILAAGSFVDYPLRSPIVACFSIVVVLWMNSHIASNADQRKNGGNFDHAWLAH